MKRHRYQGVWTIVRFNWHFFVLAGLGVTGLLVASAFLAPLPSLFVLIAALGASLSTFLSLAASHVAYDTSGLYKLDWLAPWMPASGDAANIHAGFDETSALLQTRFPAVRWRTLDFYDPKKHTEISIRRARAAHAPQPGALACSTTSLPLPDCSLDSVLLLLAAHEIRDHTERVRFFRELRRTLRPDALIIVTEHLRDPANLIAYTIGAWHFHTPAEWLATFEQAGLVVVAREKTNRFITTFILRSA